jgi:uncharacterized protein (TIGR00730 family)
MSPQIASVAVFCGSRAGNDPAYATAATTLGAGLARTGRRLVYGGGSIGLMGILADAVLAGGGDVLGVIPGFIADWEVAHPALGQLDVVNTMHERKARLYAAADCFIGLPGGIGTLDELIEIITWRALGQHEKPILLCDIAGSARPLVAAIEAAIARGFSAKESLSLFEVINGAPATLARLDTLAIAAGK